MKSTRVLLSLSSSSSYLPFYLSVWSVFNIEKSCTYGTRFCVTMFTHIRFVRRVDNFVLVVVGVADVITELSSRPLD